MLTLQSKQIPYDFLQKIGSGTSGEVFKGFSKRTGKKVAIKQLISDLTNQNAIKRQIEIHRSLDHENVVHFIESYAFGHEIWVIMELCNGNLNDLFKDRNPTYSEILEIAIQLFKVMNNMNNKGIFHLDLKPENILYTNSLCLKVSDFGCSQFKEKKHSQRAFGTSKYMPPQVKLGKNSIDKSKVDIWSFGVILYQLVFRCLPIQNDQHLNQLWQKKEYIYYPRVSNEKKAFISLIQRLLQIFPENRANWSQIKHLFVHFLGRDEIEFEAIGAIINRHIETCEIFSKVLAVIEQNQYYHTGSINEYPLTKLQQLSKIIIILNHLYCTKFDQKFKELSKNSMCEHQYQEIKAYGLYFQQKTRQIDLNSLHNVSLIPQYQQQLEIIINQLTKINSTKKQSIYKSLYILTVFFKQYLRIPLHTGFCSSKYMHETLKLIRN